MKQLRENFRSSYQDEGSIIGIKKISEKLIIRNFIDTNKIWENQKYIIAVRFYNSNYISVDLISMPLEWHKNIVYEHLIKCSWRTKEVDHYEASKDSPYLICGGVLRFCKEKRAIKINGGSGDYGGEIFGYQARDISAYILKKTSKIPFFLGIEKNGENFFMKLDKMTRSHNIYELLKNEEMTMQQRSALNCSEKSNYYLKKRKLALEQEVLVLSS